MRGWFGRRVGRCCMGLGYSMVVVGGSFGGVGFGIFVVGICFAHLDLVLLCFSFLGL